jgi:hypothetical protein
MAEECKALRTTIFIDVRHESTHFRLAEFLARLWDFHSHVVRSIYFRVRMAGDGQFAGVEQPFDREAYRARLREMSDDRLRKEGRANREMCKPSFTPVRQVFVDQLDECRKEWRRRHPAKSNGA